MTSRNREYRFWLDKSILNAIQSSATALWSHSRQCDHHQQQLLLFWSNINFLSGIAPYRPVMPLAMRQIIAANRTVRHQRTDNFLVDCQPWSVENVVVNSNRRLLIDPQTDRPIDLSDSLHEIWFDLHIAFRPTAFVAQQNSSSTFIICSSSRCGIYRAISIARFQWQFHHGEGHTIVGHHHIGELRVEWCPKVSSQQSIRPFWNA